MNADTKKRLVKVRRDMNISGDNVNVVRASAFRCWKVGPGGRASSQHKTPHHRRQCQQVKYPTDAAVSSSKAVDSNDPACLRCMGHITWFMLLMQ